METRVKILQHYIDGRFVAPVQDVGLFDVINPATEECVAQIQMGTAADADLAVAAAHRAFQTYGLSSLEERIALMEKLLAAYERRYGEVAEAITTEMGAPKDMSFNSQAECGSGHIKETLKAARELDWEVRSGKRGNVVREPIGVCGLITPWNWPMNQVAAKVVPALLAGCTVVLKPSEMSPLSAQIFAECVHEAGYPAGVFNMVHGTGPTVGNALSIHPDVELMSFTGSTRAGIAVAKAAADTVKRVSQELGGKSPNIIFADADLETAVKRGVLHCFGNTGQSCNSPTRMLVEASVYDRAVEIAAAVAAKVKVGDPTQPGNHLGPLASKLQFERVQKWIETGIAEGARLVAGGLGRPEGLEKGYFVRPTVFAGVNNDMAIARNEVFGPVLVMIPFQDLDDAIRIANDTPYGLAAYVQTKDLDKARNVARRLRAGSVYLNGAGQDYSSPFGGFKQSGNGREWGKYGLLDFVEFKAINGYYEA
jgi:aldehyde dehydrogenase (NAD+)